MSHFYISLEANIWKNRWKQKFCHVKGIDPVCLEQTNKNRGIN